MPRFRLTGPHVFMTVHGPARYEAGIELDSEEVIDFRASPHMIALDTAAQTLLTTECDRLRRSSTSHADMSMQAVVIGFGPVITLPA
jgi:hypothetical protein